MADVVRTMSFAGLAGLEKAAPYVAGAVVIGVTAVVGFFGHKHISVGGGQAEGKAMMPHRCCAVGTLIRI